MLIIPELREAEKGRSPVQGQLDYIVGPSKNVYSKGI
jgi:hypothetical protein